MSCADSRSSVITGLKNPSDLPICSSGRECQRHGLDVVDRANEDRCRTALSVRSIVRVPAISSMQTLDILIRLSTPINRLPAPRDQVQIRDLAAPSATSWPRRCEPHDRRNRRTSCSPLGAHRHRAVRPCRRRGLRRQRRLRRGAGRDLASVGSVDGADVPAASISRTRHAIGFVQSTPAATAPFGTSRRLGVFIATAALAPAPCSVRRTNTLRRNGPPG